MFKRLLIANRGEVAVRIARGARELGVTPIGVASRADLDASWLEQMEEAVCIGGSAPGDSYLRRERIVQAALQTRCSAVHPGWGFLAEDPRFALLCQQHGLTFVGPSAAVMRRMGKKSPAKEAMRAAGLEWIPGSEGLLSNVEDAVGCAKDTGYPVMLKADSGGGGRGMRLCHDEAQLREAFVSAQAESEAAFGDGSLYLERYIDGGRHIEVQVLCGTYGRAIHLGERECSIQRSHQKLIEESPSPALDEETRQALGRRAARAAQSIGYRGVGTIEFLRDDSGRLYFMEMNTRLQVEHPVTEAVTGIDLVRAQLEVAANGKVGVAQVGVKMKGHAIECRINAEDPEQDFRPSPGKLTRFDLSDADAPTGRIRVDTHLREGDVVPPFYDSLIAKVIAHGDTRDDAIEAMQWALKKARIEGVATTIPLHQAVLASPEFRRGEYDTRRIPGWSPSTADGPAR